MTAEPHHRNSSVVTSGVLSPHPGDSALLHEKREWIQEAERLLTSKQLLKTAEEGVPGWMG